MKKSSKIRRRQTKAEELQKLARLMELELESVVANRKEFHTDSKLYAEQIPGCESGGAYVGEVAFTAGVMLECWDNCPEFTLPNGSQICKWSGSPLSGVCVGLAYNEHAHELHKFTSADGIRFSELMRAAQPYMEKAKKLRNEK